MSFGFGVGDFLAVLEIAHKIRKDYVGAPAAYQGALKVARNSSIVLLQSEEIISERELNTDDESNLHAILGDCQTSLEALDRTLAKYYKLGVNPTSNLAKLKRARQQALLEPAEIRELCIRVTENVASLTAFLAGLTRDDVKQIRRLAERQEYREIINWISTADYSRQLANHVYSRTPGTGRWVLEESKYKYWIDTPGQTLCCQGIPGAGKTILTTVVVDDLISRFEKIPTVAVVYLYCSYGDQKEQTSEHFLLSILKQLCQQGSSLPETIQSTSNNRGKASTPSGVSKIRKMISEAFAEASAPYQRIFILIDALDECSEIESCREELISALAALWKKSPCTTMNLLITTRPLPSVKALIVDHFEHLSMLDIRAAKHDVLKYVESHIAKFPRFLRSNEDLQRQIGEAIAGAVDGMFLLARLYLNTLRTTKSARHIKDSLRELQLNTSPTENPAGDAKDTSQELSAAYKDAYSKAMDRIKSQLKDEVELAEQALDWLVCAKRPLSATELRHALSIRQDDKRIHEDGFPDLDDVVSKCAGLVTLSPDGTVQLVHFTTQQYLEQEVFTGDRLLRAHITIAEVCATHLLFDGFEPRDLRRHQDDEAIYRDYTNRVERYPLYRYCADYWSVHARQCGSILPKVKELLLAPAHLACAEEAFQAADHGLGPSHEEFRGFFNNAPPERTTHDRIHCLHYAISKDWMEVIPLIATESNVNVVSSMVAVPWENQLTTPLSFAAACGNERAVSLLLAVEGVDVNTNGPLECAVGGGHHRIAEKLLVTGQIDGVGRGKKNKTALHLAAGSGDLAMVRLSLGTSVGQSMIRAQDKDGITPIAQAAASGHYDVVRILLETGKVNFDGPDAARSIVPHVLRSGDELVIRMLLETDNVEIRAEDLEHALRGRNHTVVKELLDSGKVDPNLTFDHGHTPLSLAVSLEEPALVELMLNAGPVDVNPKGYRGFTPLHEAVELGALAIVDLLLSTGEVDVNVQDEYGMTALVRATMSSNWQVEKHVTNALVERLLGVPEIDLNLTDNEGPTALTAAVSNGDETVVDLLLSSGKVDLSSNQYALHLAVSGGYKSILEKLLATGGFDVGKRDSEGRTAFSLAVSSERAGVDIVQLLLDTGCVDVNTRDNHGRTPLELALNDLDKLTLLLDRSHICVKIRGSAGQSPLSQVVTGRHQYRSQIKAALARALLTHPDVEPDARDHSGRTALSLATRYQTDGPTEELEPVSRVLIDSGRVDLESKDDSGRTVLSWAAENNNLPFVQCLLGRVDVNAQDNSGRTPLSWAATPDKPSQWFGEDSAAVLRLLLEAENVDPDIRDMFGRTPLSWAAKTGNIFAAKLLVEKSELDPRDDTGRTPLSWAASSSRYAEELISVLLDSGKVDLESRDGTGRTPLSWAASSPHWPGGPATEALISRGADVNSTDQRGRTPLHWAADGPAMHLNAEELSKAKDVDLRARDCDGMTALDIARKKGFDLVAQYLQ